MKNKFLVSGLPADLSTVALAKVEALAKVGFWLLGMGGALSLGAVQVADLGRDGVSVKVDADPETVDIARDFFVTITVTAPKGVQADLPDLRDRFEGFGVAEDFQEDSPAAEDGSKTIVSRWRLVPLPAARRYRLAPFPVAGFATAPVLFAPPPPRDSVTGDMEISPKRDLPPLSWKLVGWLALIVAVAVAVLWILWITARKVRETIRVHRLSPIQRAFYELNRLLEKGLPGRGFYKDFYVELTMVVRRYIQRQHGVKAPHLTTEEFLRAAQESPFFSREAISELKQFLESADMVKFAGVEATPVMADAATNKARDYLTADSANSRSSAADHASGQKGDMQ